MRAAILLLLSQLVWCAPVETVLLDNGDRLTGEILKVEDGKLTLKTGYAGIVSLDWERIEEVISDREFQVESETGLRLRGFLPVVHPASVVRATPLDDESEAGFWHALDGSADLGYSLTRGNVDLSQSSFGFNARFRTDSVKIQTDITSLFSRQEGSPSASRHSGTVRVDRTLSPDAFLFTNAGLERDERRALNLRTNAGGGLGWRLIKGAERELSLLGGVNYVNEQFRLEPGVLAPPQTSGEGQIGLDWRTSAPGGMQITTKVALTPNIVQLGRYRVVFETGARVPLIGRYVWNLNVFNRYDSRPPVAAQKTDYGAISSLGVTF